MPASIRARPAAFALATAVIVVFAATLTPARARAAPDANALFERAKKAYVQARVERSLKLLRRAARKARDIKLAAQIELYRALNLLVMRRKKRAEAAFLRALRNDPTLTLDKARFKPSTVALLEAIRGKARGKLVVTSNRPATVWLDGEERGKTPLTLEVKIGRHRVQVRAGAARFDSEIVMGVDAQLSVPAHLPLSGRVTGPTVKPKTTLPSGGGGAGADGAGGSDAKRDSGGHRLWTWVALGGALAAAGVGIGLALSAKSDHDEYQTTLDYDRFHALQSSAETKATVANVLFVGGGVLLAGAVALFFVEGHLIKERARERTFDDDVASWRVVPAVGPQGARLSFDLRF